VTCARCQAENRDGARFCRGCGATLGAVCAGCGAEVEAGSKFCDSCGAPLAAAPAQPAAPPRLASPESYTPKHLAEKILTSKTALEGERKQVTSMESMGMVQWRTPVLVHLGEAYLLAGRREDALATAGRGLTLARERGHRVAEAWALRLLAEIVSRPNAPDVETAEGHYRQALALAHELGMRPLEAHCHFGLGEFHRRTGERAKAAQHLATARAMYHEMGMDFWLAKAETARTTAS
jgi:tetratricopeptide (TPR) repeat protein